MKQDYEASNELRTQMPDKKKAPRDIPIGFDENENVEAKAVEETDEIFEPDAREQTPISKLQSQVDVLMSERASLYDKLLRRQAEFENYRKRVERERAELYQHGRDDVLLQFLPVVDNF